MAPVFSNKFESFTENNFFIGAYDSVKTWFDTSSKARPLDFILDALVFCADVVSIETYLSDTQSYEPNDFVFAISFIEHISIALSE